MIFFAPPKIHREIFSKYEDRKILVSNFSIRKIGTSLSDDAPMTTRTTALFDPR